MPREAILVAGGAGYIGAQTCKALAAEGYVPVTLDNLSTGHHQQVKWGPLHVGDIADRELVRSLVAQYDIKGAIHFAAFSLVGESVVNPAKYYANNVGAATSFASALIEADVKALVFSSTAAVYGVPDVSPIPETAATRPINPYGETKLAFEGALRWLGEAHALRWTALRYFNAAGADPDGEIGESHEPETHLIPLLCAAALGKGKPLTVFGQDYDTEDGTPIRDYIHVVDLAKAHIKAIRRLIDGGDPRILNVGGGEGVTVLQVIAAAERALGMKVPYSVGPRRPGDPPSLVAGTGEIRQLLDWRPTMSDLDTIVQTAALWQRTRAY